MSSTNRGYERHKTDYYVTPLPCIKNFLGCWLNDLNGEFHDDILDIGGRPDRAKWLDPCAGGDANHPMSYPTVIKEVCCPEVLTTNDMRQDSLAELKENYLWLDVKKQYYDVIITNPPFYLAEKIIEKALRDVKDNGYVVMLLRLNFFGSNARKILFDRQMPIWSYVHHRRMSFTDDGKTDSIEYMHAVWQRGNCPEFTMLRII